MPLKKMPLARAFTLVEPGPVLLLATREDGRDNLMTCSWHMVLDFSPRFAVCTGPWNHSFGALMRTKECVLAVPGADLAERVVDIGDCSGADTDKFARFSLTPLPAGCVRAPLVGEALGCVECRVTDYFESEGIIVLQGLCAWENDDRPERRRFHANGDGTFVVDGETRSYRERMADKLPSGV